MDIEGFEFDALTDIVDSGYNLPESISVELHYATYIGALPWKERLLHAAEIGYFMDWMLTRGGYLLVARQDSYAMQHVTEISLGRFFNGLAR